MYGVLLEDFVTRSYSSILGHRSKYTPVHSLIKVID